MKIVLNYDDLHFATSYLLLKLDQLKDHFPNFKVTLFGVPQGMNNHLIASVQDRGFIQIGQHGWTHMTNFECYGWVDKEWIADRLDDWMTLANTFECLVEGFKGPGWTLSPQTVEVLNDYGWWIAANTQNPTNDLSAMKRPYVVDFGLDNDFEPAIGTMETMRLHGHMQDAPSGNGLVQTFDKLLTLPEDTEFLFIDEVMCA